MLLFPSTTRGRARVLDHAGTAVPIDAAPRQLAGVKRDTHHTVRMDPAPIGLDQLIGADPGIGFRHGATLDDRAHEARVRTAARSRLRDTRPSILLARSAGQWIKKKERVNGGEGGIGIRLGARRRSALFC
jgi:hypothetical protein